MQSFYNSLSKNGVIVMQLGESPEIRNADETFSKHRNRVATTRLLEKAGFESIHTYEEVRKSYRARHCCFLPRVDSLMLLAFHL